MTSFHCAAGNLLNPIIVRQATDYAQASITGACEVRSEVISVGTIN